MKLVYFFLLLLITGCNTPYFTSANNMRNIYGKVFTRNGAVLEGEISVNNEGGLNSREYIRFKEKGKKETQIPFADFYEIEIRNEFYTPKKIESNRLFSNPNRLYLLKRLTKSDSRIQFYEFLQISNQNNRDINGNIYSGTNRNFEYYIQLPTMRETETYNIERRNVVPDFEDKVSAFVKDCDVLANKIKRKEKGYFYAQISLNNDKKIETWLRIIDEYNACK